MGQTAAEVGLSEGAVRTRASRALARLRTELTDPRRCRHDPLRPPEGGDPMELDENRLAQRFDRAVSDLTPDVVALVEGGRRAWRCMRRRRRIATGAGSSAAAAVTVGAVAYGSGALRRRLGRTRRTRTRQESSSLSQRRRAGMAAAVIDLLGRGDPFAVGRCRPSPRTPSGATQVDVDTGTRSTGRSSRSRWSRPRAVSQWGQMERLLDAATRCADPLVRRHTTGRRYARATGPDEVRRLTGSTESPPTYRRHRRGQARRTSWWPRSRPCWSGRCRTTPPTPCR